MKRLYATTVSVHSRDQPTRYDVIVFEQPLIRYVIGWAYWYYTLKVPRPLVRVVDRIDLRLHARECDGGCVTGRRPDGTEVKLCGYPPFGLRQDLRSYELLHAGRRELFRLGLTRDQAVAAGWNAGWDAGMSARPESMSSAVRWRDIRAEHVERAGGEAAVRDAGMSDRPAVSEGDG